MRKVEFTAFVDRTLTAPRLLWVLLGFAASYVLFFLIPVIFRADASFGPYVPVWGPHAVDLRQYLAASKALFDPAGTPYTGRDLYPPLLHAFVAPLLLVDFPAARVLVAVFTVGCYVLMTLVFPMRLGQAPHSSALVMLIFVTGLFSYGLAFELERGQFNVIAVFCSFLAIYIYHYHHRWRLLGYALMCISVQAKLYPLIFIVLLIDDWNDWKRNLRRMALLILANCALVFALGHRTAREFLSAATSISTSVESIAWWGNHSIRSFLASIPPYLPAAYGRAMDGYMGWANAACGMLVAICLLFLMFRAWRRRSRGIDSNLLLACTLGALLIPSISNDYTLSILAAPVALYLISEPSRGLSHISWVRAALLILLSFGYSSTLFSYVNRPPWLANSAPALMVMMVVLAVLCALPAPAAALDEAG